jgi:hypothetical protein
MFCKQKKRNAMINTMLNRKSSPFRRMLILQGLLVLLIAFSCKSGSNQNVLAEDKPLISDESQNMIRDLYLRNFQSPDESNTGAISGHFYVSVKIEKGGKLSNISITESEDSLKVPLLNGFQFSHVSSDSLNATNRTDFVTQGLFPYKEEAKRITRMLETLDLPEWQEKSIEFALSFNIQ